MYKDNMFDFLHKPNIDDLDDLSNHANELIRAGQWDEAEKLCQKLREQFPEEIDGDDRTAQLYQKRKDYKKALSYAQTALYKARRNPGKFDAELIADLKEQVDFLKEKAGA